MNNQLYLALTLKKRLIIFCLILVVCFFVVSVLVGILMWKFGNSTPVMRISIMIQNLLLFITPPVVTALLVTRQPATLLAIDTKPGLKVTIAMVGALVLSVPAMNLVIYLNENLPLPEELAQTLRAMEDTAGGAVSSLFGDHTIANLILTILIVGVMAGVSEELLFRGGLQRLLVTGGVNPHVAIWTAAVVFSFVHMQFFGFVPRMLLGALFGYALWWSGSLWLPILLHTLNNTMYAVSSYINYGADEGSWLDNVGKSSDFVLVAVSVVLTILCIYYAKKGKAPQPPIGGAL